MMTTIIIILAHHVQALTITVQNVSRMVTERMTEAAHLPGPTNQRPDPNPKAYPRPAAQAPQNAMPPTMANGKSKAKTGPIPPK